MVSQVKIRCSKCKAVSPYPNGSDSTKAVICGECGARSFPSQRASGADLHGDLASTGVELAEVSRIDLPSANSVLLGLMTLHQAQSLQDALGGGSPVGRKPEGRQSTGEQPPVKARRDETLNKDVAVGENERKTLSSRAAAVIAVVAILAALVIGAQGLRSWQEHTASTNQVSHSPERSAEAAGNAAQPETASIGTDPFTTERDASGHVTRIIASTPEAVLVAYCREISAAGDPCDPLEVATTRPNRRDARLGLLRWGADINEDYAITILEDPETGSWTAGSGDIPLVPEVVVPQRIGDRRRPVSAEKSRS